MRQVSEFCIFMHLGKSVEKYKGEHIIVEGKKSPPEKDFAHVAKKSRGKK